MGHRFQCSDAFDSVFKGAETGTEPCVKHTTTCVSEGFVHTVPHYLEFIH